MNVIRILSSQSRLLLLLEASGLIALMLAVDYYTPLEFSMFVFYALPIFVVSLICGPRYGLALAVATALLSWAVNLGQGQSMGIYAWRGVNRMVSFLFVAGCAIAVRREREVFRERLEAIEHSRELEKEIVRISEREQMRIGQDLHDGLCQTLAAIDCAAAVLKSDLEAKERSEAKELGDLQRMLQNACVEARSLARGIFPVQMDVAGLGPSLQELTELMNRTFHVPITLRVEGEIYIADPAVAMHLYRIAQEALSNALRHARPTEVAVRLKQDANGAVLSVIDNGSGFAEGASRSHGMGLRSIRYRAGLIGAEVAIAPTSGSGVEVRCSMPAAGLKASAGELVTA